MDPSQYTTLIVNELRYWTQNWIDGLRDIRQQQGQQQAAGLVIPYPNYPLPVGFPFDEFMLSETFEWIHEDGYHQRRHIYNVRFVFQGRTHGSDSSIAWSVVNSADETALGVFEIAGPIYDSPTVPFQMDTDLVLEAMSASLGARAPVHLASRVVLIPPDPNTPNGLPRPLRIYELRRPTGPSSSVVIRRLGTCWEV
ncbi:hypothetical protein C8R45DRAFT_1040437 [Mycena sanguinolenta]|nr:hypothetical protein C8R45DRAFT_1040437 [Mycena sanguinolenta]